MPSWDGIYILPEWPLTKWLQNRDDVCFCDIISKQSEGNKSNKNTFQWKADLNYWYDEYMVNNSSFYDDVTIIM